MHFLRVLTGLSGYKCFTIFFPRFAKPGIFSKDTFLLTNCFYKNNQGVLAGLLAQ